MGLAKKKIFYGWWIVLSTSIICGLGYGTWLYSFGVFFKPMMAEFGWSRAMTAGAYSLRSIQGGIASPVLGWVIDKYGGRVVIIGGAIVSGLGFVLMYFVNSLWSFYLINGVILSIGMGAMLYLSAFTVIAKWFVRRLSLALSLMSVGAGVGGLICAPASALLISHFGWRMAFVVTGLVIWAVALPLALVIRNSPAEKGLLMDGDEPSPDRPSACGPDGPSEDSPAQMDFTLRQALLSRPFWLLVGGFFFQGMAQSVVVVHAIPALTDAGLPLALAAFSLGLVMAVSIIGRLLFGYLGDRVEKRILFMICYAMVSAGTLVLMVAHTMSGDLPLHCFVRNRIRGHYPAGSGHSCRVFRADGLRQNPGHHVPPDHGLQRGRSGSGRIFFRYQRLLSFQLFYYGPDSFRCRRLRLFPSPPKDEKMLTLLKTDRRSHPFSRLIKPFPDR